MMMFLRVGNGCIKGFNSSDDVAENDVAQLSTSGICGENPRD